MLTLAIVLSQNISGAFYTLLSRRLSTLMPHAQLQISATLYAITVVAVLPFAWHFGDASFADLQRLWPFVLLCGLATAISGALALLIFRYMDAAMGSLLMTTHVVMAVIAAMFVLGERMGLQEIIGGTIVVSAVAYALSVHVSRRERRNWTLGILFTLAAAVCFAVSSVTEKFLLGEMSVTSYLTWGWSAQCLCAVLLSLLFGRQYYKQVFAARHTFLLWGAGLTRGTMGLMFVLSLVALKNLCLAVVLAGLRPLFVSLLAAWVLRERQFLARKVIASVIAAVGVAILFS